ncbi:MAG: DUF3326 domain-containing protein [Nostocaceae cyanobacterium]|nr:DUF3326 domain-containing protein [Nostocaceae cyanobacterium]
MSPYTAILIVPTGIGASIGGYAGDALPVAKAISQVCDRLITHPNVMNGANLYWNLPNTFYVEGYGLDQFAAGNWGLRPVHQNKVGLLLDQGIETELRLRHLQAADAARATLGLSLSDYVITDAPLNVELRLSSSGASWGTIGNPDSLLRAAETLINQGGAEAIATVARFPDEVDAEADYNYRLGKGVDTIAGAEAVISHLIVRELQIPCAHAPAFLPPALDAEVSPRAAAEELGYTFLPSVLVGLSRAPQFIIENNFRQLGDIWANQVDAIIVPANACGSSALLSLSNNRCQIITVNENQTQMQVSAPSLGIKSIQVNSYLEAIGVLVAHKAGIDPSILSPTISPLRSLVIAY